MTKEQKQTLLIIILNDMKNDFTVDEIEFIMKRIFRKNKWKSEIINEKNI